MKQILPILFFFFLVQFAASAQVALGHTHIGISAKANDVPSGDIKIFPNPATDFISLSTTKGVEQIRIYNVVGKEMKRFQVSSNDKFYINELPAGMYLVQMLSPNNKVIVTHRLNKR